MVLPNADILERLCSIISSADENALPDISKEEALGLVGGLLSKHNLEEKVKRLQVRRIEPKLVYHLRYMLYFEVIGHGGMIDRLCFDNSAKYAFSGSVDGLIKVWNVQCGMLIRTLYGHSSSINDISVSTSGEYLISADYQGVVCIWGLKNFKLLHMLRMEAEVMFCESLVSKIDGESTAPSKENKFVCVLVNGIVCVVTFTEESILTIKDNSFMKGESIKAICITDGGRFIICGGWWQFILIYDTQDLDGLYVLEEFRPQSLCASKNGLKLAASSQNSIYTYTFYSEGDGAKSNFKKRRNSHGYWCKVHHAIPETQIVERMCFLFSFLLVTVSTDNCVRVFNDEGVVCSAVSEVGSLHAHPSRDIFAVVGTRLCMYEIIQTESEPDELIHSCCTRPGSSCINETGSKKWICLDYSKQSRECINEATPKIFINKFFDEPLPISVNDCEFSGDGLYFITSDDRGVIRVFSVNEPIVVPEQQFFEEDFAALENPTGTLEYIAEVDGNEVVRTSTISASPAFHTTVYSLSYPLEGFRAVDTPDNAEVGGDEQTNGGPPMSISRLQILGELPFDRTVDINGNPSNDWNKMEYNIAPLRSNIEFSMKIEDLAAGMLRKERLDSTKFNNLFVSKDEDLAVGNDSSSSDKTWASAYNLSNNSGSTDSEETGHSTTESLITESSDIGNPRTRVLRRHVHKPDVEEEHPEPVVRRNSRPIFRPNEASVGDNESNAEGDDSEGSFSNTVSASDSSSETCSVTDSSSSKVRLNNRRSSVAVNNRRPNAAILNKRKSSVKRARRIVSSEDSSFSISYSEDTEEDANIENGRRTSRNIHLSNGKRSFNKRRIVNDEDDCSVSSEQPVILRRNLSNRLPQSRESQDPSKSKRDLPYLEEESAEVGGIDPVFEQELAFYAKRWLCVFSIYENDSVYFDSAAYSQFIELEGRLGMFKIPKTGIYTVQRVEVAFIGLISYLIVRIGGVDIAYYEHSNGTGILCLEDQWNAVGHVDIVDGDKLVRGEVGEVNGLLFKIKNKWFHRAFIKIHGNVEAEEIEYDSRHHLLFGRRRGGAGCLLDIINYDVVNRRLSLNLYRTYDNFLEDLSVIKDEAEPAHLKYAQKIYTYYYSNR